MLIAHFVHPYLTLKYELNDLAKSKVLETRPVYECCRLYEVKACSTVEYQR
jgi:hypothetical protein